MAKPKNWETMSEADQEAWYEKKRVDERKRRAANLESENERNKKYRAENSEKINKARRKRRERQRHQKYRDEIKASEDAHKANPAKLDMSKVLAFISKRDGPKSQKPITPNMAKVREFIKYA